MTALPREFKSKFRQIIDGQEMLNVLFNKGKKLFIRRRIEVNEAFYFTSRFLGGICRIIIPALSHRRHHFASTPLPILCPL